MDFGKKIVILYMFFDINNRDCKIKRMDMEGETLRIYYKVAYSILEDTSNPYARCFMLVMDQTVTGPVTATYSRFLLYGSHVNHVGFNGK